MIGGRAVLAATLLSLAACAPKAPVQNAYLALDCAKPYGAQVAALTAQPGLKPARKEPGEPYRFYNSTDGRVSYMVTEPGAPGHPAILMQSTQAGAAANSGCPYGDAAGYAQLTAYLESLKAGAPK